MSSYLFVIKKFHFFSRLVFICCILVPLAFAGVIAMSWCPNDSLYLLTCSKDNRTICWDTNSGEVNTFSTHDTLSIKFPFFWSIFSFSRPFQVMI